MQAAKTKRETCALSLHQLTVLDATPARLVELAARTGCPHICLFTFVPAVAQGRYPLVTAGDVPALRAQMAHAQVTAANLEVFPLDGREDSDAFAHALDVGAHLGATRATAHIHDIADIDQAIERFAAFAALAKRFEIVAGLEFMTFSAISGIHDAAHIIRQAGQGALVCDALHFFRGGDTVSDAAVNADLVSYVQLSDGPAQCPDDERWAEAVKTRQLPGEGALPLHDLMRVLPGVALVEVEVPRLVDRLAGKSDLDRAQDAVDACRAVLTLEA